MGETAMALTEAVYYILISALKPIHGYGIMQNVAQLTANRLEIGAGTLYGAINTLLERGWLISAGEDEGRKKMYIITQNGKQALSAELARLQELITNGEAALRGHN